MQLVIAGLTVGSAYALIALGIHVILRATRVVNFAQGEFTVLGGLIALSFVQMFGVSTWIALVGATACGFALGIVFERIVLRVAARSGDTATTIATVGCVFILLYGHALVPQWGSVPQPLPAFSGEATDNIGSGQFIIQLQSLWVFALLILALAVLTWFFEGTYYGKAIRAAANDELGASLVGINVATTRTVSVGIAIALSAYAGTILGPITLVGGAAGTSVAIKGFVGAVIGGMYSPIGCVVGGLLVGVIEKVTQAHLSYDVADPIVYTLLLLGLLIRPQGLFGDRKAVRD